MRAGQRRPHASGTTAPAAGSGAAPARRTARRRCASRCARRTARSSAPAWGPGAAWVLDRLPALLGADDDPSGFAPTHPVLRDVWRSRPGWRVPRDRAGAGGAGARGARAEGHRPGGVARLALAGPEVRRAGARSGRWSRRPAGRTGRPDLGAHPVLGLAPRRRRPVQVTHLGRRPPVAPAGWRRWSSGRPPRPRPPCAACPASACGPPPRSRSAPSVTPTRSRSATSTWRRRSAGRWSARRSTTTRCSSCWSPTAATATGCSGWSSSPGWPRRDAARGIAGVDYRAM